MFRHSRFLVIDLDDPLAMRYKLGAKSDIATHFYSIISVDKSLNALVGREV